MPWFHSYTPLGGVALSALAAALPFALLCWQLLIRRKGGHIAAGTALAGAFLLAVTLWKMPILTALSAGAYGTAFGAFPILWIIITAMWVYNMTADAGQFAIVRFSISSLTEDRRIQAVFIAFAFGALLESTSGYGSPVAIGAAMLIGLGFPPVQAAVLCLLANTVPAAYAGLGLPTLTAAQISGLDVMDLNRIIGRQLPVVALILPLWICILVSGWKRSLEIWPVLLAGGLGCALPTYLVAQYHSYTLPGLMGAVGSLLAITLVCRFWKPARIFRFAHEGTGESIGENTGQNSAPSPAASGQAASIPAYSRRAVFRAWLPWLTLTLMVVLSSSAPVRSFLNSLQYSRLPWPGLHDMVAKSAPIASAANPETMPALFTLNLLSSPGSVIFLCGLLLPLIMPGYSYPRALRALGRTFVQMRFSIATVLLILALAQIMNYSGMSYTLGLAFTHTGALFPLFSPILGWIGVFLTGSDTSSNALFCGMQRATAEAVGMSPELAAAVNSTGGVTAKMISPQSLAVAVGATGLVGQEGNILRKTIGHSLLMLAMICALTWLMR
ncbi:L-lactate permease [Desulfovibrio sp. OttesenSCG-928-C14]|nr:L-lactate permease [Desulfovibrio sp. OttesenSCG-928-C14]